MKKDTFLKKQAKLNILGLMSGTSCDGLDLALVTTGTGFDVSCCASMEYPTDVRIFLLDFIRQKDHSLQDISQINFYLARLWAGQIQDFLKENELRTADIDVIASHGQTLWHQPEPHPFMGQQVASTLQLGDPAVLANLLNIPVIGDFRVADMALGGQGAPLIPYFDALIFSPYKRNFLSLNIGGISNVTFVPKSGNLLDVRAFDCGPGNMLIDGLSEFYFSEKFDRNGCHASEGNYIQKLRTFICKQDKFALVSPPKSSGREYYGAAFLQQILDFCTRETIAPNDALYTVSDYTAYTIYTNFNSFVHRDIDELVISGGGAFNSFLISRLKTYFKDIKVSGSSAYHIDENFKEAIGFALMAHATLNGKPANVPGATGASRPAILGKICLV